MPDIFKLSGKVEVDVTKAEAGLRRVDSGARKTQQGFNEADRAANKFGGSLSGLSNKMSAVGRAGDSLFGSLTKSTLAARAIEGAITGATGALKEGWQAGVDYQRMLESGTVRMSRFFQTAQLTKGFVSDLQKFATVSPIFEMSEALQGAQRLLDMKIGADKVIPSLTAIGDAVGAVGGGKAEIDRVTYAFSQMHTAGKITGMEMRQLAEVGIPAWELLAKAIGKTEAQTKDLVEQGRISGDRGVAGIIAMMGEKFAGQSQKAGQTLAGLESQFNESLNQKLGAATQGNFEQLKTLYKSAADGFGTEGAQKFSDEVNKLLGGAGKAVLDQAKGLATGELFTQGAKTVSGVNNVNEGLKSGNYGQAAKGLKDALENATGQPLLELGTTGGGLSKLLGFDKKMLYNSGADTTSGFTEGMKSKFDSVIETGKALSESITKSVKGWLGIQSPSTVFAAIGQDVAKGLDQGIADSIDRSSEGVKKWAKAIETAGGEEFLKAVEAMAKRLKIDPNKIMNVMAFESGLSPSRKNPKSSGSGLIQFMDETATGLGTTVEKLRGMDAIGQLKYVEAYFKQFKKMADTQEAVYTSVLAGHPVNSPESVLFSNAKGKAGRNYRANAGLDKDASGTITAREAAAQAYKQGFLNSGALASAPSISGAIGGAVNLPQLNSVGVKLAPVATELAKMQYVAPKLADALPPLAPAMEKGAVAITASATAMDKGASQAGKFADAIEQGTKQIDKFGEAFGNAFDDLIEGRPLKDIGKSLLKDIGGAIISNASGGKYNTPGQALGGMLSGALGLSGGGGGIGAAASGGSGGGVGGAVSGALGQAASGKGLIGGLFNKAGGFLSKLPGVGGFFGKLFGIGGKAAGAAAGAAGGAASGGGGLLAALGFSNPISAAITGAMFTIPLLMKAFGKDPLKDYRNHIKGEYGIDVGSKSLLASVMQAGQSKYGADYKNKQLETVRLPEVRESIFEYASAHGLKGNGKLFSAGQIQDQFWSGNVQKRERGGDFNPGWLLVGERGPELMKTPRGGTVIPNHELGGGGFDGLTNQLLQRMVDLLSQFEPTTADALVRRASPSTVTGKVREDYERNGAESQRVRKLNLKG